MTSITPIQLRHAPYVQQFAADPSVAEMTLIPHPYPENAAIEFITTVMEGREKKTDFVFAIEEDGVFAGACGLHNRDEQTKSFELGYWIAAPFRRRGIATRAVSPLVQFAFNELKVEMLYAGCLERNIHSRRVLVKNGFSEISRTPNTDPKWKPDDVIVRYERGARRGE